MIPTDEQPYPLPDGWQWVTLDSIAECLDNLRSPVNASERAQRPGKIPYYGATGQVGWIDDFLTDEQLVLLGEDGAPFLDMFKDKAYIIEGKAWVNNHAHILRSRFGNVGNKFLCHYLNVFDFSSYVNGTTRLKLTQSKMKKIPTPLPPLDEQQRIVALLDELFADLDEAKALAQAVVDGSKLRRAAILHKAFTGELSQLWRDEHGTTLDSWRNKEISEVAKIGSGGTPSRKNPKYYCGDIPWVKTGEIFWNEIFDTEEKITSEALKNSSAKIYPVGTVLVAMYGQGLTRGRASILKIESSVNQAVCALCPCEGVSNRYLYYFFMANYWQLREKAYGGNQPNYSATMISRLTISLPPLEEQKEIVRLLDDLLGREQRTKDHALKTVERVELMKKSILARAFRGELGINKNLRAI